MFRKYLIAFLIAMLPIIELRGAIPAAIGMGLQTIPSIIVCVIGNMIPVPFIYLFARKLLTWGTKRKHIKKVCTFLIEKGEKAGQKLINKTGRGGLDVALILFVGIPLPGTGAWTGALGASFLNMGFKSATVSICIGVILSGIIMTIISLCGIHIFGL